MNSDAGAACLQLQDVATRDEATIQELQELLEEQQRQQTEAGVTMAAAEQQLQQISQRTLQLGQDVAQRQGQVDDLQVPCMSHAHCLNIHSLLHLQLQLCEVNQALALARGSWSAEVTALKAELAAALVCKANADTLIELLQQQCERADVTAAQSNTADAAVPQHADRASRRLSGELDDRRATSARVVTLQWELGRCNAERQG